jgi:hypothetical protein
MSDFCLFRLFKNRFWGFDILSAHKNAWTFHGRITHQGTSHISAREGGHSSVIDVLACRGLRYWPLAWQWLWRRKIGVGSVRGIDEGKLLRSFSIFKLNFQARVFIIEVMMLFRNWHLKILIVELANFHGRYEACLRNSELFYFLSIYLCNSQYK